MLLAADVGGTKTLVGLYRSGGERPQPSVTREYVTLDFDSFDHLVQTFIEETAATGIEAVCAGVAGPVRGTAARLTNVPWTADIEVVAGHLGGCPGELLNDLEAMAYSVPVLDPDECAVLQQGVAVPAGNAAIIAAGTGMGQAHLHNVNGRFLPVASEGGHADFAARTPRELALVAALTTAHGRVDVERVISGHGLMNLFQFVHGPGAPADVCPAMNRDAADIDLPAATSAAAIAKQCDKCVETLGLFVSAYGAEAGNLALRSVATAGLYVGGGIAPKILPLLETGTFMDAFLDKAPMVDLLRTIPVKVILNRAAGLLGAAVRAQELVA
jgi:glucokinase